MCGNRFVERGKEIRRGRSEIVVERFFEIFLELAIGEHFFEFAPRGFAPFDAGLGARAFLHSLEQAVVVRAVLVSTEELVVEVEAFVVSLGHLLEA
jgi:hypothetical protein